MGLGQPARFALCRRWNVHSLGNLAATNCRQAADCHFFARYGPDPLVMVGLTEAATTDQSGRRSDRHCIAGGRETGLPIRLFFHPVRPAAAGELQITSDANARCARNDLPMVIVAATGL